MILNIIIIIYGLVALFHAVNFDASKLPFSEKVKNFFSALIFPIWWIFALAKKIATKKENAAIINILNSPLPTTTTI